VVLKLRLRLLQERHLLAQQAHPHAGTRLSQSSNQRPVLGQLSTPLGIPLLQPDDHLVLSRQARPQLRHFPLQFLPASSFLRQKFLECRGVQRANGEALVHRALILRQHGARVKSSLSHTL